VHKSPALSRHPETLHGGWLAWWSIIQGPHEGIHRGCNAPKSDQNTSCGPMKH
jgi:hypothetical protein